MPTGVYLRRSAEDRFWDKVDRSGNCWLWLGAVTAPSQRSPGGYGQIRIDNKLWYAHRFSFFLAYGYLPERLDHRTTCPKNCVFPLHLREVTNKQNMENVAGPPAHNTSGIQGVTWHSQIGRWRVQAHHNGKHYSGGCFPLEKLAEAEQAAIDLRNRLFTHNDRDRAA